MDIQKLKNTWAETTRTWIEECTRGHMDGRVELTGSLDDFVEWLYSDLSVFLTEEQGDFIGLLVGGKKQ